MARCRDRMRKHRDIARDPRGVVFLQTVGGADDRGAFGARRVGDRAFLWFRLGHQRHVQAQQGRGLLGHRFWCLGLESSLRDGRCTARDLPVLPVSGALEGTGEAVAGEHLRHPCEGRRRGSPVAHGGSALRHGVGHLWHVPWPDLGERWVRAIVAGARCPGRLAARHRRLGGRPAPLRQHAGNDDSGRHTGRRNSIAEGGLRLDGARFGERGGVSTSVFHTRVGQPGDRFVIGQFTVVLSPPQHQAPSRTNILSTPCAQAGRSVFREP
mmetsp:Transcript_39653/g.125748  ORF Transcript_39653/g.125748 Transcript_39653/m.125748 type:complete len:269 (+) Transcript_39653:569-1375(+)